MRGFSSVQAESLRDLWCGWVLLYGSNTYKEKNTDTTSETVSQPEQKGFGGFLFIN